MLFSEILVSLVVMQNRGIWNFHGSLTLDNGKPICYFKSLWYDIHELGCFGILLVWLFAVFVTPHA